MNYIRLYNFFFLLKHTKDYNIDFGSLLQSVYSLSSSNKIITLPFFMILQPFKSIPDIFSRINEI